MKQIADKDIIAEIHQTRDRLAAKFNYDVKAFFEDLMQRQAANASRLSSPNPKKVPPQKDSPEGE